MKKILVLLAMTFTLFSAPPIVSVHLGPFLPPYYKYALQQAMVFNPDSEVYLLVESKLYNLCKKKKVFIPDGVRVINVDAIPHKQKQFEFRCKQAETEFYWRVVIERLFVLERFMIDRELRDMIHIEGDVLLYSDFEHLIPEMQRSPMGVLMGYVSDDLAGPGISYFRDAESIGELTEYILQNANVKAGCQCNDMLLSARSNLVGGLPVVPPDFSKGRPLTNVLGDHVAKNKARYEGYYEYQGEKSLFDPNPFGQYVDGLSKAHASHGVPGYICPNAVYQFDQVGVLWKNDSQGRKVPYISFEGELYRMNNIHVHSKRLEKFISW